MAESIANALAEARKRRPLDAYERGVVDAIDILNERGERIGGAVQPDRTELEIRKRLLVD